MTPPRRSASAEVIKKAHRVLQADPDLEIHSERSDPAPFSVDDANVRLGKPRAAKGRR